MYVYFPALEVNSMVIKVFCGSEFAKEHEKRQFEEIYELTKSKFCQQENKTVYILLNFNAEDAQIDVTMLTEKGPAIIELKSYEGTISGDENGQWQVNATNGPHSIDNVFAQLKKQRFALCKKLTAIKQSSNSQNMAQIEIQKLANIKCYACFKKGSVDKTQINQKGP
jgi:hypothetical protein